MPAMRAMSGGADILKYMLFTPFQAFWSREILRLACGGKACLLQAVAGASLCSLRMPQLLGAIFFEFLANLLEVRDIAIVAKPARLAAVQERRLVPINRPADTASLNHGLPPFKLSYQGTP